MGSKMCFCLIGKNATIVGLMKAIDMGKQK